MAAGMHYSMLRPGSLLPSESSCVGAVSTSSVTTENAPWNEDDGSPAHWNSNQPPGSIPSYFYNSPSCCTELPKSDFRNVDGNYSGTTDDLIRISACKWGIDEDYIRAQSWIESGWHQDCAAAHGGTGCSEGGDENNPAGCTPSSITGFTSTSAATPTLTASGQFCDMEGFGGLSGTNQYDTWGIAQTKVYYEWATWPMIEESTPFSLDYRYAEMRGCVNGDQYGYFNSQSRKSGSDYKRAVSNATNNPSGPSSVSGWTNLQYLAYGCIQTHFTGNWFNGRADSYLRGFLSTLNSAPWPGGQR
jgi:hypothetical protein